jgi:hypothetical protein
MNHASCRITIVTLLFGLGMCGIINANPALTPGTWVNITPPGIAFNNNEQMIAQGIAFDPNNRSTIYWCNTPYSSSFGGIYKSTNGGSNWRKVGKVSAQGISATQIDEPLHVRIDPNNSNHLYIGDGVRGGTQGFWVSNDGGENFTRPQAWADVRPTIGYFIDDVYDVAVDPTDFNHILVSSHASWKWGDAEIGNAAGVMESKDGGTTWIVHKPIDTWGAGHAIHFLYDPAKGIGNSQTWLLGTQGSGHWRTSDGGTTWTRVYPEGTGIVHGGGTIYYSKTGVLYAAAFPKTLRSTDNGINWIPVGPDGGTTGICGDGNLLYTARTLGNNTPYWTSPETDGIIWTPFNGGKQTFQNGGPFEMAFDAVNGIMYSSNWEQGCWALKVDGTTGTSYQRLSILPDKKVAQNSGLTVVGDGNQNSQSQLNGIAVFDLTGKLLNGSAVRSSLINNCLSRQMIITK